MLPDFNRLKIFFYIYTRLSISMAAEDVHTTPSAVSQQLRKLEEELGLQLFARPHKRLVPTSAAHKLFKTIQPFKVALEKTVSDIQRAKDVPSGLLKLGAPVEFGKVVMPELIAGFRTMYADVHFHLHIGRTTELLPMIHTGELDFAFVDSFPVKQSETDELKGISLLPVFEETVVLASSQEYAEKHIRGDYSYENIAKQCFIAQQPDARAIKNWFTHNYGRNIQQPKVVLSVANHQAVVNAIQCHIGLGIIVFQIVQDDVASGKLSIIKKAKSNPVNKVFLAQLLDKVPNSAERIFQEYVLQIYESKSFSFSEVSD